MLKKIALLAAAAALAAGLSGCATAPAPATAGASAPAATSAASGFGQALTGFSNWLSGANAAVEKYAPLVGKDVLMIDNMIIQAECSPAMPASSQVAANVLQIVAPDSKTASKVETRLQQNAEIAAQLCPLYQAITAEIGPVSGAPSQTISTGAAN